MTVLFLLFIISLQLRTVSLWEGREVREDMPPVQRGGKGGRTRGAPQPLAVPRAGKAARGSRPLGRSSLTPPTCRYREIKEIKEIIKEIKDKRQK
jgi:hypothetical protein